MAAFAARGATVQTRHDRHGLLILEVEWPLQVGSVSLEIGYSPLHPFHRPVVSARGLQLERHQHPFDGGLCLLVPDSGQWYPHQKVADLIEEQLSKILRVNELRSNENWAEAAEIEEQAPDPLAAYYTHAAEPVSAAYFASPTAVPPQNCGVAEFSINARARGEKVQHFEALLHTAKPVSGKWLAQPFEPKWLGAWSRTNGRWVRLERPLPQSADDLLALADAEIARQALINPAYRQLQHMGKADLSLTAIVFEDEVAYGARQLGDGWLFIASRKVGKKGQRSVSLIRGFGISDDLFSRVPVAAAMRSKNILLFGCGAIGSFVALELARAGIGKLTILDYDIVEPGNSVRWPLGRSAWGVPKTAALRDFLVANYPSTNIEALAGRLGETTTSLETAQLAKSSPRDQLRTMIEGVDLVIDATASTECQLALSNECRALGKPLVIGYATEGVVGGVVARFRPAASACWVCLNEHWEDKSIALPPANPTATVLPIGCNSPTFTGGSFDLQEVSLEVVRSAIGLLAPNAFDAGDWDWSSLTLAEGERRCLPTWRSGHLAPHPRCAGCGHP
ncbi:ThiF family adenylyltransferase [Sphingobium sp. H33]|uniref:ThiF family adenylyltransferase n=2 Tax=Sphingobium nicotianae TaxID=2782607 RepID=A0A9X1IT12_9SPHN|nr:ThiF family adenylyltransferase [Sphingobium nicotianae]